MLMLHSNYIPHNILYTRKSIHKGAIEASLKDATEYKFVRYLLMGHVGLVRVTIWYKVMRCKLLCQVAYQFRERLVLMVQVFHDSDQRRHRKIGTL